ncbi:stress-responsive transcription factor hsf1 [Blyttiomyces sp. JEL0837]|nr:stress-responsive transcription factor hsf1 [Blyttiomyces sp. JEL0837]
MDKPSAAILASSKRKRTAAPGSSSSSSSSTTSSSSAASVSLGRASPPVPAAARSSPAKGTKAAAIVATNKPARTGSNQQVVPATASTSKGVNPKIAKQLVLSHPEPDAPASPTVEASPALSASSLKATGEKKPNSTATKNVPAFLNKLYNMVSDSSSDLIHWSEDGRAFIVQRHEDFAREVLPRFFKHNNFSSFVRQLNMYGFHKVPHLQQGALLSDGEPEMWEFANPHFQRNQPDLLCLVTRKKGTPMEREEGQIDLNSILQEIAAIKRHQLTISSDFKSIQRENQVLWNESIAIREQYSRQQETIDKILRFLASIFSGRKKPVMGQPQPRPKKRKLLLEDGSDVSDDAHMIGHVESDNEDLENSFGALTDSIPKSIPSNFGAVDDNGLHDRIMELIKSPDLFSNGLGQNTVSALPSLTPVSLQPVVTANSNTKTPTLPTTSALASAIPATSALASTIPATAALASAIPPSIPASTAIAPTLLAHTQKLQDTAAAAATVQEKINLLDDHLRNTSALLGIDDSLDSLDVDEFLYHHPEVAAGIDNGTLPSLPQATGEGMDALDESALSHFSNEDLLALIRRQYAQDPMSLGGASLPLATTAAAPQPATSAVVGNGNGSLMLANTGIGRQQQGLGGGFGGVGSTGAGSNILTAEMLKNIYGTLGAAVANSNNVLGFDASGIEPKPVPLIDFPAGLGGMSNLTGVTNQDASHMYLLEEDND